MSVTGRDRRLRRIVAHRGASGIAPENTLPAFRKALSLGVEEVEFDLWATADRRVVVFHDRTLDRTTTGSGPISERTWDYIRAQDAGIKFGPEWVGTRIPLVEEVFDLVAGRAGMNIHIKEPGEEGMIVERVRQLAECYGVTEQVYIAGKRDVLQCAARRAPQLARCCLEGQECGSIQVQRALELACERIQLSKGCCSDEDIRRAVALGLIVNYFFCDEPDEGERLFEVGVTALLTNHPERYADPETDGN